MQKANKAGNLLQSLRKMGSTKQEMPLTHIQPGALSGKLYQHIREIPLHKFIDCEVSGNFSALVISGNPSAYDILEAWQSIKMQFADAIGNHEYILFKNVFKEITVLSISLAQISMMIDVLRKVYNKGIADKLNKALGTKFHFNQLNPESYHKTLDGCVMRSKSIKIKIDLLEMQQAAMKNKHDGGGGNTYEYYDSMLITLSDHVKYEVKNSISVYEFCTRVKRFNKYCEEVEKLKNKNLKR